MLDPWRRLVEVALEPNVFLEPFFLLPALEYLGGQEVEVVELEALVRLGGARDGLPLRFGGCRLVRGAHASDPSSNAAIVSGHLNIHSSHLN